MVSITSLTGSTEGVIFDELQNSEFKRIVPRVTKAKTLDGGVSFDHRGVADGDREFRIKALIDETTEAALIALQANETYTNISCPAGFFVGVIADMMTDSGFLDLTFWVKE